MGGVEGGGVKGSLHHRARSWSSVVESLKIFSFFTFTFLLRTVVESLKIFSVLTFTCAEFSCGKSEDMLCFNFHFFLSPTVESLNIFSVLTFTFAEFSCGKSEDMLFF